MSADEVTVRRLLSRPATVPRAAALADEDVAAEYAAFSYGRVGNRPQMTLVFRQTSGEATGFPYAHLSSIRCDASGSNVTIAFGSTIVALVGTRLGSLFRCICEHRVQEVVQLDRTAVLSHDDTQCLVHSIAIRQRTAQYDWND